MLAIVPASRAHTSSVQHSTVCMTGKSIDVFYEVFAGMVIWYFLSRARGKTCYSGSNKVPTTAKTAANMTTSELIVFVKSIYLFFQSRLLLHPVWLLWFVRRLIALIPSHSLLTFNRLFTRQEMFQMSSKMSTLRCKCRQTARKIHQDRAVWRSGETFLKESAPCCQIFSFFSCLFPPVAIVDLWALCRGRREGLPQPEPGKEKHEVNVFITRLYLSRFFSNATNNS